MKIALKLVVASGHASTGQMALSSAAVQSDDTATVASCWKVKMLSSLSGSTGKLRTLSCRNQKHFAILAFVYSH